jgi:hypothetical protein
LPSSSFFWTDAEVAASKFFPRRKRFDSFAAQHWSYLRLFWSFWNRGRNWKCVPLGLSRN